MRRRRVCTHSDQCMTKVMKGTVWRVFLATLALAFLTPTLATAQPSAGLAQAIASCERGEQSACRDAGMMLSDVEHPSYDAFLSLRFLQTACAANDFPACGRLALIFYAGEGDVERDLASAGNFASHACSGQDRDGCEVAEAVFADGASPQFDAGKALRYRRTNCNFGNRKSCIDLARIYYTLDDYLPAEQVALAACRPADPASAEICTFGKTLQDRRHKIEAQQRAARQAAQNASAHKQAVFDSFMAERNYDSALYYALYHSRSAAQAETATLAAAQAGAISTIFDDHFYVLEYWFPSGPVAQIAASEIAKRRRSNDCGIYNCSNTPGASTRRWQAQNGGSSARPAARSSGSYQPAGAQSSTDIHKQVRDKYRQNHCGGGRDPNSPVCR